MFSPLEPQAADAVVFKFDGQIVSAPRGASVAAALLSAGIPSLRSTSVSGASRGPFCMMGACFDCLVQIDGVTVQACMTPVADGLVVERVPRHLPDALPGKLNGNGSPNTDAG
jgi:predicted molibdopterin-dependent oxidoreductase YjgC